MKPERWRRIESLYYTALERDATEREAFLAEACAGDEELRREVESLLAVHEQSDSFLAYPALDVAAKAIAEDQPSFPVGQSLGHYRILSLLGKGGMGEVYCVRDTKLDRTVALKLLPVELALNQERMRRFVREAKAASALNHPHVATIYEIGEADGVSFIAMEYVEGRTLADEISGRPLDVAKIIEIGAQVADALDEAHSKGITHRDIKPANLMLTPRGRVKVLDFGLAKVAHPAEQDELSQFNKQSQTTSGVVMGTVAYMSPEQALGREVDHRSDIFSLGVALYEMATGQRPFRGATASETIDHILHSEPEPLAQINEQAPAALAQIVSKCLAKEREQRYQSARDLLTDLDQLRSGGLSAPRALPTAPIAPTPRVRDAKTAATSFVKGHARWLIAGALVVAVLTGALAYWRMYRVPPAISGAPEIKSLAVLPLENLTGDPAQNFFSDGMTETLIAGLSKVAALRVSSRTSVLQYKQTRKPLADIARELNVDAIVEGSVQRFGEQVIISARLIHAPSDRQLWADTYERDLRDALALQSEIAQVVIKQIQVKLTPQEQTRLANARPVNPAAYEDYLRGRYYANRQNKADNETTITLLERAVATDPSFAAAHAELAQAYIWRYFLFTPDEKQWQEKAHVAIQKSLSLDPDLAVAYLARGRWLWTPANHFPHEQAIQEFRRALALNPNLDEARNQLAMVYNHIGAFDQSMRELQKAVAVNPTNHLAHYHIGQTLLFQGKYEQALTTLRRVPIEANPAKLTYHMAMALLHLGRKDETAALVEEFLKDHRDDIEGGLMISLQALLAALSGEERKAEAKIRNAITKGKGFGHFHHTAFSIACAYAALKKNAPALQWLQAAADDGFPCYALFESEPYLDSLKNDPRFVSLLAQLNKQWESYRALH